MINLRISALVILALSTLCFLLGGAVTGGGQVSGSVDVLFFFAKLLLGLTLLLGVLWLIRYPSR
jgi:hypothetical protein|nr:hypothetical protein [Pseudomonas sp. UBA6718]